MALISSVTNEVRVHIPELPTPIATRYVINAMREFMLDTRAWRTDTSSAVDLVAGTSNYTLSWGASNTDIVEVLSVNPTNGKDSLKPTSPEWLDKNMYKWWETQAFPTHFFLADATSITVAPVPSVNETGALRVRLAIMPQYDATEIWDIIYQQFREDFINGALTKLYLIPKMSWTNPGLAAYYKQLFEEAKMLGRVRAENKFSSRGVKRTVKYGGY